MLELIFWFSIFALCYIYAGYPALIWLLACCRARGSVDQSMNPPVSVVIVAHNESASLPRKIKSVLESDCPSRIVEVLIASDGSTDQTGAVVGAITDPRVRLLDFPVRRGKASVLNDTIPQCSGDIVVLTDARQELHPRALCELADNFADPAVGIVSGHLVLRPSDNNTTVAHGIGIYWHYDKFIRKHESRFRSVPGATGALYAIRKHLFGPIHPQTLLDDVVIPMQIVMQGFRCLFEPAALAYDRPSDSLEQESLRKRRTIAGNAQLVVHHPGWLLPWRNPIWLEYMSHKISRLFSPFLLIVAAVTNISLAWQPIYAVILSAQVCFYLSALAGWAFQKADIRSKWYGAQLMFLTLNIVTIAALWDAVRGRFQITWKRPS